MSALNLLKNILNSIVLNEILWDAQGNKCAQFVRENFGFGFKEFKPIFIFPLSQINS